ncbi:uncharacterized protein PV06_06179 [Exophiala oligosperma]|uniref:Uncharacterized protein n=1 Tax=Exophiala oligosperma TaxID=215243 RepID=A0A0D2ARZ0_9EURO|nr:uncharacterized protein PV06_06179 [Exophiala oligosperma]KIW42651.1 hypothetical protein PV06_06179 [Exophiala oligosperma]
MNPNHSYNYSQSSPGPPQPPWQAPPRKSGWADPRLQPQAPLSPQNPNFHAFGPPLPPPPDPGQHPPTHFETSSWGVPYYQSTVSQSQESRPPLPPRPPSATGRISPQPGHAPAFGTQQQPPIQAQAQAASHQYGTSWGDPYQSGQPAQDSTLSAAAPVPPPPPPRPAAYQAEIESYHNRVNTPHNEYSHKPPTHHYEPQQQNTWNTPNVPAPVPSYYPSAPAPHQVAGAHDGYLVSPIEASNGQWNHQARPNPAPVAGSNQISQPQVLGFGGPSDWEHYEPGVPPEQTPTSPHHPQVGGPSQYHAPVSPPTASAVPPTSQTPMPVPSPTPPPVEIGIASPVSARRGSHQQSPKYQVEWSQPSEHDRPSSASGHRVTVSGRSDSSNSSGNIDSVIHAWTTPLRVKSGMDPSSRPESRNSAASPGPGRDERVADPYADLAPEFKASLKRYATMLRKEAAADSDEEKYEIFEAFVSKELRLRSLLYGVELRKATKDVTKAANPVDIQAALPKPIQDHTNPTTATGSDISAQPAKTATAEGIVMKPPQVSEERKQSVFTTAIATSNLAASSPVASGAGDDEAYSPGGRPKVGKAAVAPPPVSASHISDNKTGASGNAAEEEAYSPGGRPVITVPSNGSAKPSVTIPPPQDPERHLYPTGLLSPSINAPMVLEDYAMAQPPSPGANAPIMIEPATSHASPSQPSIGQRPPVAPIKFEPPRPAYTPFRYSAATQDAPTKPTQPADQAYSSLRHSMAESGRLMTQEASLKPPRPSSATGRKEQDEAFIGLIRNQSMAVRQKTPGPPNALRLGDNVVRSETPASIRVGTPPIAKMEDPFKRAVVSLRALLPEENFAKLSVHSSVQDLKTKIEAVPDKFTFIHETVVKWDRTNREVRRQQDAERRARQEESEAHIDALFNDNEIGYADIGDLEAEFKLAEAERRYRENQEELESFTAQVYTPVTERLRKEIQELSQAYATAMDLLAGNSEPASQCFKARGGKAKMAEVMACVLTLFNKIEIRHRKMAEADVERERRRKHLELTVLYTNNDKDGMKKLEQEFAAAEKAQVLHEARAKDDRANKLMDAFDRATVRGLGDNQTFIDDVLVKVQNLKQEIAPGGQAVKEKLYEPSGARDTLSLIQDAVDLIMTDSRKLLALSNEADVLLNDADFGVSVAEASVSNAGKETYASLENEKAKEDGKLVEEVNSRIASVVRGPQHALDILHGMIDELGDDPEHQDRIKKALEAAKQRNALNDPSRT